MLQIIKYILFSPVDMIILFFGILKYKKYKKNSYKTYKSMLRLFYIYGGFITDLINSLTNEKIQNHSRRMMPEMKKVDEDGFFIQENFLNFEEINELKKIILEYSFKLRPTDEDIKNFNKDIDRMKFNPDKPKAVLYEVDSEYLINQKIIQQILLKDELTIFGKDYFGSEPFFDHVSLSVTTDYKKTADSSAAQFYHFDLDRPKWLKFLIYVNNVDLNNGPHCFIRKTHKKEFMPFKVRSKGYVRLNDNDSSIKDLKKNETIITAKSGTAIIEDTKGLHKGSVVTDGYRILLNIQINSSMFGTPYKTLKLKKLHSQFKENFKKKRNFFKYTTNINEIIN
tara:strand:- start:5883 stop:6899 length:1017 start_codon:yes stop_codon:yes gene_type:complete